MGKRGATGRAGRSPEPPWARPEVVEPGSAQGTWGSHLPLHLHRGPRLSPLHATHPVRSGGPGTPGC